MKKITSIVFVPLVESEWRAIGCPITKPYNKGNDTKDTPYDPRLGALENRIECEVCCEKNTRCPGHWGYIPLVKPFYNPEYRNYVLSILKCICIRCSEPRIKRSAVSPSILALHSKQRLQAYKKKAENLTHCPECQKDLPSFFLFGYGIKLFYDNKKKALPLDASEALNVLMKVSTETMQLLGINEDLSNNPLFKEAVTEKSHIHEVRPEAFILSVLPVAPTSVRPWVIKKMNEKKADDITDRYNTILKINNKLLLEADESYLEEAPKNKRKTGKLTETERKRLEEELVNNIWALFDNNKEKAKAGNNRKRKSFRERLSEKDGHIQTNVAGKRADYTARTVIESAGRLLPMGWFGVPRHIANTLTSPELVTSWNIDVMNRMLEEGKIVSVIRGSFNIKVNDITESGKKPFVHMGREGLQLNDTVNRKLRDGDWILVNRQPSLRIESMQGFQAKIRDEYCFRLPPSVTRAFNADYDGDEMNIHCPQSIGARVECSTISRVAFHIVSAQNNAPIMGCVQNTLLCMYMLTHVFNTPELTDPSQKPNYKFQGSSSPDGYQTMVLIEDFMDAIMAANISLERYHDLMLRCEKVYPKYVIREKSGLRFTKMIPGKIVASIVFPNTFCWQRKTETSDKLPIVQIENGLLTPTSGPLCKKIIGGCGGSAIHPLWRIYSPDDACRIISELHFIASIFITRLGFSIGISDCISTKEKLVKEAISKAMIQCEIINQSSKDEDEKEREINNVLNKAMDICPELAKTAMLKGDRNSLVVMKSSGAKGSDTNNGQIAGFIGQQNIDGKRIPFSLTNYSRALPHFLPDDNSPTARGFVSQSYIHGLDVQGTWYHATAGRRGVIDTALKTGDSGYIQKKTVKKTEDVKAQFGYLVDSNGNIIQFAYGGDGFDAKCLMWCEKLDKPFFINPVIIANVLNSEAERTSNPGEYRIMKKEEMDLLVSFIKAGVPAIQTEVTERITYNIKITLRFLLENVKIYESVLPKFCRKIKDCFENAKVKDGYAAGIVAACSIGEPTTQLTLNTFHFTGLGSKDVTVGVPRLKEVFNATKNPSKPSCTVFLKSPKLEEIKKQRSQEKDSEKIDVYDKDALREINPHSLKLQLLTVSDLVENIEMKYLPSNIAQKDRVSPINFITFEEYEQSWWVTLSNELKNIKEEFEPVSWVLIFKFNIQKLYTYKITPEDIAEKIENSSIFSDPCTISCVASPANIGEIEIYVNFKKVSYTNPSDLEKLPRTLITEENIDYFAAKNVVIGLVKSVVLQGVKNITKTFVRQNKLTGDWIIDTKGSNLMDILGLPNVDSTKTMSDDIWEIYKCLGIEATRGFLIKEITKTLSFDGTYINQRHISLLVDTMCKTGTITSVNRDGISRDVGPNAKIIFEKPVDNIAEACAFGEKDHMKGVSAAVMYGTLADIGPGCVEIKDMEKMS